ncbi:hypothetical protein E2C01_089867 [Portunus trituberculatus]|uniref:Uncharacterized protein n=1 Tax=Portunus trituberculatus TaxID=210409 RepID=A0A5B7JNL5_PORTR|nr:hypothetical protein [Portunus trituberculatus]
MVDEDERSNSGTRGGGVRDEKGHGGARNISLPSCVDTKEEVESVAMVVEEEEEEDVVSWR